MMTDSVSVQWMCRWMSLLSYALLLSGPTVLSVLLLIAVLVNFILRFQDN